MALHAPAALSAAWFVTFASKGLAVYVAPPQPLSQPGHDDQSTFFDCLLYLRVQGDLRSSDSDLLNQVGSGAHFERSSCQ